MCNAMRALFWFVILTAAKSPGVAGNGPPGIQAQAIQWPKGLPVYDHVVVVIEENKDYDQIIGKKGPPYINGVLKAEGATFTQMYAEEHFSQGNYFWLFCGSNLNVGFHDDIPSTTFDVSNLAQQLIKAGKSFKGYSETLPAIGSDIEFVDDGCEHMYGRKHVPWVSFKNLPPGETASTSCNLRWTDFPDPGHYSKLPKVAFVIPNLRSDMHNGALESSIECGDTWLKTNLGAYYQWAKTHNSLLILTFDESDDKTGYTGLTDPSAKPSSNRGKDLQNRIVTIFAGDHIHPGEYPEGNGMTHVNILRTLEAMYGLSKSGAQQVNALRAGISDDYVISDVFVHSP
jgi:phosphatidylinositol-3-phosphatase